MAAGRNHITTNIMSERLWDSRMKTTFRQASLSITNSQSLLKLMSIELMMPSRGFHTQLDEDPETP